MTTFSILLRKDSGKSRIVEIQVPPLTRVFNTLKDWRKPRGKVYTLESLLIVVMSGMMCGKRGLRSIARWCKALSFQLRAAMGLRPGRSPSRSTLGRLMERLDEYGLERAIRLWVLTVNDKLALAGLCWRIALDGKTLRGAAKQGAEPAHLLAAVSHQLKLVLGQVAVDSKTNEIKAVIPLLNQLVLEGRLFTMDALLTQRAIAQTIVDGGGDYLMYAKENQPTLRNDIALCFDSDPLPDEVRRTARTTNKEHGRLEVREIVTSSALKDYIDWPGLEQVMQIKRTVTKLKTGETSTKIVYALTSRSPECAGPKQLLEASRGHWTIENSVHWVRDVILGEDASSVRKGSAPQVFAALRNLMLNLIRLIGYTGTVEAIDIFSAKPERALRTLGVTIGL